MCGTGNSSAGKPALSRRCPAGNHYSRPAGTVRGRSFQTLPLFISSPTRTAAHLPRKQVSVDKATVDEPSDAEAASHLGAQNTAEGPHRMEPSELLSTVSLFLVAILWGTNPVCLRYTYLIEQPPSPAALAAIQGAGAAVLLTALNAAIGLWSYSRTAATENSRLLSEQFAQSGENQQLPLHSSAPRRGGPPKTSSPLWAGAELGLWTFLANAATITAFQHTPASRGAFLLRLTAVFTPAVSKLFGQAVSLREWAACCVALLGGILISLDGALSSQGASGDMALGVGDALMVMSAVLWSLQTVRLGRHARGCNPLSLAQHQTMAFALLSGLWLAGSYVAAEGPSPVGSLLADGTAFLTWAAVLWPALGPWGIGTALQVRAQGTVSASRTQIILATDPVWATLFAGVLGAAEQSLGMLGWAGAGFVLAASAVSKH